MLSAKSLHFFWILTSNFLYGLIILFTSICSNLGPFYNILLYFVNLFCLLEFSRIIQNWTAGAWNNET
jgi:hypothetical protein